MIGPLLFLTYISDITDDVASLPLIYADDATPFEIVNEPAGRLNSDLNKISEWADKWLVTMNPVKSHNTAFSFKRNKQDHPLRWVTQGRQRRCVSHSPRTNFAELYVVLKSNIKDVQENL